MATAQGSPPTRPEPHPRLWKALERKPLTVGRAAQIIAFTTLAVTLGGGVLIRFTDHRNFHDIGDGLWWSIQTVTTVGYGDLVPTNTLGRLIAALVMLAGIGFLTVVTATITSTFVEAARQRAEGAGREPLSVQLDQISTRLDAIDAALKSLDEHHRDEGQ
jgi:voltage-gated potassium channel